MWVDDDGIIHTVSVPDPATVLGVPTANWLKSVDILTRKRLSRWVIRELEKLSIQVAEDEGGSWKEGSELASPDVLLIQPVDTIKKLKAGYQSIPFIWKADLLMAVDEML